MAACTTIGTAEQPQRDNASKRPRTRYTVGRNTAMVIRLTRLLSDRMLDRLLARNLKPYLPKAPSTT